MLIAGIGYGGWYAFVGSHHVSTDNAYVGADTAQITPMVTGQVAQVLVSDAQTVRRGDILVRIDDRDARITLDDAEAALAKARRQFGQTSATGNSLSSQLAAKYQAIASARAGLASAQAAFEKARVDLDRRAKLVPSGRGLPPTKLTSATNSYASAKGQPRIRAICGAAGHVIARGGRGRSRR